MRSLSRIFGTKLLLDPTAGGSPLWPRRFILSQVVGMMKKGCLGASNNWRGAGETRENEGGFQPQVVVHLSGPDAACVPNPESAAGKAFWRQYRLTMPTKRAAKLPAERPVKRSAKRPAVWLPSPVGAPSQDLAIPVLILCLFVQISPMIDGIAKTLDDLVPDLVPGLPIGREFCFPAFA